MLKYSLDCVDYISSLERQDDERFLLLKRAKDLKLIEESEDDCQDYYEGGEEDHEDTNEYDGLEEEEEEEDNIYEDIHADQDEGNFYDVSDYEDDEEGSLGGNEEAIKPDINDPFRHLRLGEGRKRILVRKESTLVTAGHTFPSTASAPSCALATCLRSWRSSPAAD